MTQSAAIVPPARRSTPPASRPSGFAPEYDAFEPRFANSDTVTLVIFGIEDRGGDPSGMRQRLMRSLRAADGPVVLEHGTVRSGYGPRAEMWFAYWRDASTHAQWTAASGVEALFEDESLLSGSVGLWREHCLMSLDHNETSYSRRDDLTGIASIADALAVTEIHGYWGSARDRVAAAAHDPLDPAVQELAAVRANGQTIGRRIRVAAPDNVCLIRSSQDINRANAQQLGCYADDVEPTLLAGLKYLRDNREESGCLGALFVDERDEGGRTLGRTCVVAFFTSLSTLEAWTHRHATHEAIMTSFVGMVRRFSGEPGLHLWHEITVFPEGSLVGEYVNCSPDSGLLRFCA